MLYYLFQYLNENTELPGVGVFQYLSFRSIFAFVLSLIFTIIFGNMFINFFKKRNIIESSRDLGLENYAAKAQTPSMGGIIIISAVIFSSLLLNQLDNVYILLLIFTTIIMGCIGGLDDYIKIFKKNKAGLKGKYKIYGQSLVGLITAVVLLFHEQVSVRSTTISEGNEKIASYAKSYETTLPFLKNQTFDYASLFSFLSGSMAEYVMIGFFIFLCIFIVVSVSNGVNLTDGLDGLVSGNVAISASVLAIFSYFSGNAVFSDYLLIFHIPESGEITIFIAALMGACMGFLWYNSNPAQVFMGDTGSLTLGSILAITAICIKKELLIPILCGIFLIESLSVIIQVSYFKYTKKRFGTGIRVFKMSPIHHHFQKIGWREQKVVVRFWLIGIILAGITLASLKLR